MKIILVATDARGKNLVFVSNTLQVYSLEQALALARAGKFQNISVVKGSTGAYLRTDHGTTKNERLDKLSISSYQLFSSKNDLHHALSTPAFSNYWLMFQQSLKDENGPFIVIDGSPRITEEAARERLQAHRGIIFAAAKKFDIDSYLLGAILIDEIARLAPLETIRDYLTGYFIGINTSIGIAQVETDTARKLIQKGYYNPDPQDSKLSAANIQDVPRSYLYEYVKDPIHNIFFAAARMRALTDEWGKFVNLSKKPEIIATLYHLKYKRPHVDPRPNDRGLQIAGQFYRLAQEWLHSP